MEHHDPFVENPHRWDTAYGLVAVRSSGYFVWIDVAVSEQQPLRGTRLRARSQQR